jgi:CheY-like chemotaxis protein
VRVARILHVEDNADWQELIRRRLKDHHVDSAGSQEQAVDYLQRGAKYDLALVDLNLETDSDLGGGEVLDLLRNVYPDTRRVVVTGSPPAGSVRANVFERFDVEEIIIKGQLDTPDLRRVVEEALTRTSSDLPQSLRLRRSELRQRYRDWHRRLASNLRKQIRVAEEHISDAARVSEQTKRRAASSLEAVKSSIGAFEEVSSKLRIMLDNIKSSEDLARAADALDAAEDEFTQTFDDDDLDALQCL